MLPLSCKRQGEHLHVIKAKLMLAVMVQDVAMALVHSTQPRFGVQFHPESICTTYGAQLVRNFYALCRTMQPTLPQSPSPCQAPNSNGDAVAAGEYAGVKARYSGFLQKAVPIMLPDTQLMSAPSLGPVAGIVRQHERLSQTVQT